MRCLYSRTTDTQWRHKSKISEKLGRCGRQNMLWPYLKIWDWDWIVSRAVKAISNLGIHSPWVKLCRRDKQTSRITIRFLQFGIQEYVVCWSLLLVLGSASEPPAMLPCQHAKGLITGSCYKIIWTAATALSFFFILIFIFALQFNFFTL